MPITKKKKTKFLTWIRAGIQILFFIFLPGAFNAAFAGVKYILTQIGAQDEIKITSLIMVLIVLCIYTIIFGRFFCGFACAFGALGDWVRALYVYICKKLKKKPFCFNEKISNLLSYFKYLVLLTILIICFLGKYSKTKGYSQWDVFSMLHALNFNLTQYTLGMVLLVVILIGMALEERFFCKFVCPMGAVFSFLPVLPLFVLVRDRDNCIPNCKACSIKCPSNIGLPSAGKYEVSGDCFQCQKCISTCPKSNVHTGIKVIKGNEIWFTIIRAIILFALFVWLGI